jgi:hypothetical protein
MAKDYTNRLILEHHVNVHMFHKYNRLYKNDYPGIEPTTNSPEQRQDGFQNKMTIIMQQNGNKLRKSHRLKHWYK